MKSNKKQAATRLFKKLSALRATLPDEEREILDGYIVVDEVKAHTLKVAKATKTNKIARTARALEVNAHTMKTSKVAKVARTARASEVNAHTMKTFKVAKVARTARTSEVNAHTMKISKATKAAKIARQNYRIGFDQNTEEYKIQE